MCPECGEDTYISWDWPEDGESYCNECGTIFITEEEV